MIDKSRGRRRIAALASGALAAGALAILPGVAGLSAASAASATDVAYTCDITMSGGFASYGGEKAATLTLDTDAPSTIHVGETVTPALTYTLTLDPAFAAQFGPSPVRWMKSTLTAATKTGATAGSSAAIGSAVWERGGGMNSAVPALTLTGTGGWGEVAPTASGTLPLAVGTLTGTLAMATWFGGPATPPTTFAEASTYPMTCTPDSDTDTAVDSVKVYDAPAGTAYTCDISMSGGFASYGGEKVAGLVVDTDAPATMEAGDTVTPTLTYTLTLDQAFADQFGPSPVRWMKSTLTAATKTGATAGSSAAIGSAVWERGGGMNSAVPALTLTGSGSWGEVAPTATGSLPLAVGTLTGTLAMATWFGGPATPPTTFAEASTYPMTCTPDSETDTAADTITVAEPTLGYTCELTFGSTYTYDSTLAIHVTEVPETVTAGQTFPADVDITLDMGSHSAGPVQKLSGDVLVDLSVGDAVTEVEIPVADATLPDMTYVGSADVTLTAPDETGAADIEVGGLTGDFVTVPDFGTGPVVVPCVADEEQDQKVGATTVEAAPVPLPDGLAYTCFFMDWAFPAYIDTEATLPASVKQGASLNPAVISTVTWIEDLERLDWLDEVTLPEGITWENWPGSSRSLIATYQNGTGVVHTSTSGADGSGPLTFGSLPVTESGDMVWSATGTYGAVSTAAAGTRTLAVGDVDLAIQTKHKFTGGAFVDADLPCTLLPGQDTALGSVAVEAVPTIGLSGGKVTGTNKVGQQLTASVTSTPADAAKAYQWLRNGAAISGATAATYTAVPADLAKTLSVRITVTKADFQSAAATVAAGKVAAGTQKVTGKAKATGKAKVGKKLTAVPGKAAGATIKYQWLVNGKAVKKATAKTMKLSKALKGKRIAVKVTYVRAGYTTVTQTSSALKVK